MAVNEHHLPIFPKLEPRTPWTGGRLAETDLVNLGEAAHFASKHAGVEITTADFLRAAGRGEIPLRAISPRTIVMLPCRGSDKPMTVPAGGIPTLPLDACKALSNTGRAMWRTYDGFEHVEEWGELCRFTRWQLPDNEGDLLTTPDECRLTGRDVHALADAYVDQPTHQEMPRQSQSNNERRFIYWASIPEDKPVKVGEIPLLVAEAIQTNELAQAAAEMNVWEEIKRLVGHDAWTVRNPLDLGPHTFPHGQALKDAVIFPWEAVKWFEHWGVGLRFLPAGNGPELWNLANAATAIANQEGWHIGARDTLLEQMVQAVCDKVLFVRDPHTDLRYWPDEVRDFYELVTPADVNHWLALDPVSSLRWKAIGRAPSQSQQNNSGQEESPMLDESLRLDALNREAQRRERQAEQAATGWYYLFEAAEYITRQRGINEAYSDRLLKSMIDAAEHGLLKVFDEVHQTKLAKGEEIHSRRMTRREHVNAWLMVEGVGYLWEGENAVAKLEALATTTQSNEQRWIGKRRLWRLSEAIDFLVAIPDFGVSRDDMRARLSEHDEASKLKVADLASGKLRDGTNLSVFLDESVFADDFNSWLVSAGFPASYHLPIDEQPQQVVEPLSSYVYRLALPGAVMAYSLAEAVSQTASAVRPDLRFEGSTVIACGLLRKEHMRKLLEAIDSKRVVALAEGSAPEYPTSVYPEAVREKWLLSVAEFKKLCDMLHIEIEHAPISASIVHAAALASPAVKPLQTAEAILDQQTQEDGSHQGLKPNRKADPPEQDQQSAKDEASDETAQQCGPATWWSIASAYMVEKLKAGQYTTAKNLYHALEAEAGSDTSPFAKGIGASRGSLFIKEISQKLSLKTVQNNWSRLKDAAR